MTKRLFAPVFWLALACTLFCAAPASAKTTFHVHADHFPWHEWHHTTYQEHMEWPMFVAELVEKNKDKLPKGEESFMELEDNTELVLPVIDDDAAAAPGLRTEKQRLTGENTTLKNQNEAFDKELKILRPQLSGWRSPTVWQSSTAFFFLTTLVFGVMVLRK